MKTLESQLEGEAMFFKVDALGNNPIVLDDVLKVLKSLTESYNSFIEISYLKSNKKLTNKIKNDLKKENSLVVVDLKFESFGISASPLINYVRQPISGIENFLDWKRRSFIDYKNSVLVQDYNSPDFISEITNKYTEEERNRIFKPIIAELINNKNVKTTFKKSQTDRLQTFKKLTTKTKNKLVSPTNNASRINDNELITSLALIQTKGDKSKPKVLTLFDEINTHIVKFEEIKFEDRVYELKFPLFVELIQDGGIYSYESKQFGIFAFGKSISEAKESFVEEFDFIYNRYNSMGNENLSEEVIEIKRSLNLMVK